jgi:hypothetical protein
MIVESFKLIKEILDDSKKNSDVLNVMYAQLKREMEYNITIFFELEKAEKSLLKEYISLLKTDFYDSMNDLLIPLSKIIPKNNISWSMIREEGKENKNFIKWSKNLNKEEELIERIYLRIMILKSLASIEVTKRKDSYQYVRFLIYTLKSHWKLSA